jgi:long-chain acyl-CoA synthetase
VAVETDPDAADPPDPCIVVAAPHRHWLDGFAVQAALPRGRRTVTVTNRDFAEHFAPVPGTPRRERLAVGLAYHLLWPLVFSFVILPRFGGTREGLQELGRLVDRGLSPIAFPKGLAPPGEAGPRHESGIALMAVQTGLPVVPVWLAGNDALRVRPRRGAARVVVRVGAPIPVGPATRVPELVARIEAAFDGLAAATAAAP